MEIVNSMLITIYQQKLRITCVVPAAPELLGRPQGAAVIAASVAWREGGAGLKALAVSAKAGGPFYSLDAENAASGRYPLTRYLYIRMNRPLSER
jgi:hypothetical protein